MKKLISKNPIQGFKQGRKIVKAKGGVKTSTDDNEIIGHYVREKNRSLFGSGWRWYDTKAPVGRSYVALDRKIEQDGWILNPDGTKTKIVTQRYPKKAKQKSWDDYYDYFYQALLYEKLKDAYNNSSPKKPSSNKITTSRSASKNKSNSILTPSTKSNKITTSTSTATSATNPLFRNTAVQKGWTQNYGNDLWSKITDDQKNLLISTGEFTKDSFKDAKSLQAALNNYFTGKYGSLNDNGSYSQIAVDDKWGNQSQKAFNEALSLAQMQQASPSFSITQDRMTYYPNIPTFSNVPKIITRTTYDRNGIRNELRTFGQNPYSYSGAQRKALRMLANNTGNDNDKLLVRQMNLPQTLLERLKISLKKGGLIKI